MHFDEWTQQDMGRRRHNIELLLDEKRQFHRPHGDITKTAYSIASGFGIRTWGKPPLHGTKRLIDRLDAMRVLLTALDEGSLAAAAQRLGRSPAAVSRAIAFLEGHVGTSLLHRSTRHVRLTEAGERYAEVCRTVLANLDQADDLAAGSQAAPRGMLTITAPVMFGTHILRPIISSFLKAHPDVQIHYLLLDRMVNLVDEGVDVALRIARMPDSSLVARRVGSVRRVLCASPDYLSRRRPIRTLADLANHDCIEITQTAPNEVWSFPAAKGKRMARAVRVKPRMFVNADEAAVNAAVDGEGVLRVLSYKVEQQVRDGRLVILLPEDEPPPIPVQLVSPSGRIAIAKVRTFLDFAGKSLREVLGAAFIA